MLLLQWRREDIPRAPTASWDRSYCIHLETRVCSFFVVPVAQGLVQAILACHSHRGFGSKLSVLARRWRCCFELVGVGPLLAELFRIGQFRTVVGCLGIIDCFPAMW